MITKNIFLVCMVTCFISGHGDPGEIFRQKRAGDSIFKPISNLFEPYALVTNALTLQSKLYDPEINIAAELLNLEPSILDDLLKFDKNKTRKAYQQSISKFPLETGEQFLGYLDKVVKLRDDWKVVKGDIKELEAINDVIIDLKEEYYSFYSVNPLDELLTNLEAFNKDPSAWDQTKEEAAGKIVNEILNLDLGKFDDDLLPFKSLNLSICMESQNRTMTFFASMAEIASLNPEFPGNPENLLVAGLEGVESLYKSFQALKNLGNLPVNDLEKALESPLYQETFKVASEDLAHLLQPVFSISKKVAKLREKISENKDFLKRNLVHLQKSLALGTPCGPLDLTPLKQIPKPKPLDPICKPSAEAHLAKLIASSTKLANLDWTTDQKTLGLISGVFDLDTYKEASESAKKLEENVKKWHSAIGSVKDSMKTVIEGLGNLKVDKNIIKQLESFFEESTLDIIHKSCGLGVERSALIKELGSFDLEILKSTVRKIEEEIGKEETIPFAMKEWVYHKHIELNFMAGYKVYGIFDRVQGKENEIKELIMENEKVMKELRLQGKQVPTVISWTSGISDFEKMIKNLDELKANMTHLKTQNDLKSQVPKISTVFDPNLKISELLEQYELLRHSISPPESLQKARELGQKVEGIELSWSSHRAFLQYPNATSELDEYLKTIIEKEKADYSTATWIIAPLLLLFHFFTFEPYYRRYKEVKEKKNKEVVEEKQRGLRVGEIQEEVRCGGKLMDLISEKKIYQHRKKIRNEWHSKANEEDKKKRLHFRRLLEKNRRNGISFGETIRSIAKEIQNSYLEKRKEARASTERGNYYLCDEGNIESCSGRIFRCCNNQQSSKEIWNWLIKHNFQILIDLSNNWCENDKNEVKTDIRGQQGYTIINSNNVDIPFKHLHFRRVHKIKPSRNLVYMRYRKIPTGFAPFNLTPCQIMYEFFAELGSSNQVSVACMNRNADASTCIIPMIDSMMYVMTNGASFEDFYPIGAGLAAQRAKSMDLVTTAQIEFALYVCFKIINDESQYEQPMFNEEKTEFLRDLEDAWAVSWLQNYEEFEKYWGSKDFNRVYTPMENELHWYPQVKPKLEKTKESVVKFMERRRAFAKSMRKPDPYKKEEKKEEKKEGKKEEKKKNL